eukprot:GHVU01009045.1.p4 GENE.GHVU01009045.1~~GHVU01009045.1.p4  ORF type:complete len:134 (-),score=18.87 GHVU01009045.1:2979-3380(-)
MRSSMWIKARVMAALKTRRGSGRLRKVSLARAVRAYGGLLIVGTDREMTPKSISDSSPQDVLQAISLVNDAERQAQDVAANSKLETLQEETLIGAGEMKSTTKTKNKRTTKLKSANERDVSPMLLLLLLHLSH